MSQRRQKSPVRRSSGRAATAGVVAEIANIEGIYVASESAAPMELLKEAMLMKGKGIKGDRYALGTGTYSAKFFGEPGKNLTLMSADAIESKMAEVGLKPIDMGAFRRNLVVRGLTAEAVNDMVGHEIRVGSARLFVHRRTVPCKYREAQTCRPGLMNQLWDVCGVNCEILDGGIVRVGNPVAVLPSTYQPKRANHGSKPPAFFIQPSKRTAEQHKGMVMPPAVAAIMCLIDPDGFQRVEDGYSSAGQHFWSTKAYEAGMRAKKLRTPLMLAFVGALLAVVAAVARKLL